MAKGIAIAGNSLLITGGGNGIGRLMALEAARKGAKTIVIWDRDAERGLAVQAELTALGVNAIAAEVDITDDAAVESAAADTPAIDILINNAGVVSGKPFLELTQEAVEKTFAVNTLSLFLVTRQFLPGMIARRHGTVVTIASAAGLIGVAKQTDYASSKWAALGFIESLRAEMRQTNTGVNTLAVCPYFIDTGMFEGVQTKYPLILPILKEKQVAAKVIAAIAKGKQQLVLPPLVQIVPTGRALPTRLFDWVADTLGVNATMEHFTGRKGDRVEVSQSNVKASK